MKNKEYILENVKIVDVINERIIENEIVHVNNSLIDFENKENVERIDCKGMYLVPGLINLHVHLFGTGKPSKTVSKKSNSQEKLVKLVKTKFGHLILNIIYKMNLKTTINSGTTTIRSVGDFEYTDVKLRDKINNGKMIGPRIIASGYAITSPGGHADGAISLSGKTKEELESFVVQNKEKGVDLIKIMVTSGVMDAVGDSVTLMMNLDEVKAIVDKAHSLGLKVAAHTESFEGVKVSLMGGVDSIEHGSPIDDSLYELYKKNNSTLTITLSPAIPYGVFDKDVTHCNENQTIVASKLYKDMIEAGNDAIKYGLTFGVGTDSSCPYSFHYGMYRELEYFKKYIGGTNEYILSLATINNAKILGLDKEIGSIETGKVADMFLIEDNPFLSLEALKNPKMVFVKGHIIKNPKIKRITEFDKMLDTISL